MAPTISESTCAAQHFGAWAIEPRWFTQAVDAVKAGKWKARRRMKSESPTYDVTDPISGRQTKQKYYEIENGVAVLCIRDHITKHQSSFGGTSSVVMRKALRYAVADRDVRAIMLRIDSPGGTVRGTQDLADDVVAAGKSKPVHAYIEDLGASAAYWVACGASRLTANASAQVGSIGTYATLVDDTGAQTEAGVRYEVIASARYKGLGADGAITDDMRTDVRREVDELNAIFTGYVQRARRLSDDELAAVTDGRVHIAANAKTLRLIDGVGSIDDAMAALQQEIQTMDTPQHVRGQFPTAAKALFDEGFAAGEQKALETMTPKPATASQLKEAFGDANSGFIIDALGENLSLEAAKAKFVDTAKAQLSAKDAEIAALNDKVLKLTAGRPPVNDDPAPAAAADPSDPKAVAEAEWKADASLHQKFSTKDRYVAVRVAEIKGQLRTIVR